MSDNLKQNADKLIRFSKLKLRDAKRALKSCSRKFVHALSEIALNVRDGIVDVSSRIKNSRLIKGLSQKKVPLKTKYRLLCAGASPIIVQANIAAVAEILKSFKNG